MADDLKPCPFCGGTATLYHRDDNTGLSNEDWISCDGDCGASTCLHETPALAIAAWNTRATPAPAPDVAGLHPYSLHPDLQSIVDKVAPYWDTERDCLVTPAPAPDVAGLAALEKILAERGAVFDAMVDAAEDAAEKDVSFNVVIGRALRAALAAMEGE